MLCIKTGISSEIGHAIEQNLAGWLEVDGHNTIIVAKNIRCDCKNPLQCRVWRAFEKGCRPLKYRDNSYEHVL